MDIFPQIFFFFTLEKFNSNRRRKTLQKQQEVGAIGHWAPTKPQPPLPALQLSASVERSKPLNMTRPGKSV